MLVLREVTHGDQGLYAIKLSSGFTYETVHLTVSGTIVSSVCEIHTCFFLNNHHLLLLLMCYRYKNKKVLQKLFSQNLLQ